MGNAASKMPRTLPRRVETPSWAGARTPSEQSRAPPRASELKREDIQRDGQDPHFLANLSSLGPVRVDHHMKNVQPNAMADTRRMFESRTKSEAEAASARAVHNHLRAMALTELLDKRKSAKSREDVVRLATAYDIDISKLEKLARFVNSPSVDGRTVVRTVDEEGNESVTVKSIWVEPRFQNT